MPKYSVHQQPVETLLSCIKSGKWQLHIELRKPMFTVSRTL